MRIHFKTGQVMEDVPYEVIKTLCDNMVKGTPNFQTFTDKDGKYFITINVSEILYIR
jgi:hypothetical protein